jgi:hypothetical protein
MNRFLLGLAYLIVLNFELALILMGGVYGGRYLNGLGLWRHDWIMITAPFSVVLCCFVVYRYLVLVIKNDRKKAVNDDKRSI